MQPRVSEQLLIDAIGDSGDRRALCFSLGRGQLAAHLVDQGAKEVQLLFSDIYLAEQAAGNLTPSSGVQVKCEADFPEGPFQLAALPCSRRGDGELTRELMQQCYHRLEPGGEFWVSVDAPKDTWIRNEPVSYTHLTLPTKA